MRQLRCQGLEVALDEAVALLEDRRIRRRRAEDRVDRFPRVEPRSEDDRFGPGHDAWVVEAAHGPQQLGPFAAVGSLERRAAEPLEERRIAMESGHSQREAGHLGPDATAV